MFKSMKRIIKWAGKYKGRLYLGSVFSFFSSLLMLLIKQSRLIGQAAQ